jgi:hypothetical protein
VISRKLNPWSTRPREGRQDIVQRSDAAAGVVAPLQVKPSLAGLEQSVDIHISASDQTQAVNQIRDGYAGNEYLGCAPVCAVLNTGLSADHFAFARLPGPLGTDGGLSAVSAQVTLGAGAVWMKRETIWLSCALKRC